MLIPDRPTAPRLTTVPTLDGDPAGDPSHEEDAPPSRRHRPYEERYAWVGAQPFRAHVRGLLCDERIPWRVLAGLAGVPDNVVRTLVFGRQGRPRPRLPRRDGEALMVIDRRQIARARAHPVPAARTRRAIAALHAEGYAVPQVAALLAVSRRTVRDVTGGRPEVTALLEQYALAACRAHGINLPEREADTAAQARGLVARLEASGRGPSGAHVAPAAA